jgi:hypothetical protein
MIGSIEWASLLTKAVMNRKDTYNISFTKEKDGCWYVDFPGWPLSHHNLMMVSGSDDMLDVLNDGSNHVKLFVSMKPIDGIKLNRLDSSLTGGAHYEVDKNSKDKLKNFTKNTIWLCPVTLTVLGQYPKTIYYKKIS